MFELQLRKFVVFLAVMYNPDVELIMDLIWTLKLILFFRINNFMMFCQCRNWWNKKGKLQPTKFADLCQAALKISCQEISFSHLHCPFLWLIEWHHIESIILTGGEFTWLKGYRNLKKVQKTILKCQRSSLSARLIKIRMYHWNMLMHSYIHIHFHWPLSEDVNVHTKAYQDASAMQGWLVVHLPPIG